MKTCTKCKTEKDEGEFNIRRASKDGLSLVCRSCKKVQDKIYRESPEGRAIIAGNLQKPEVKEKRRIWKSEDYFKHKSKRRATQVVYNERNKEKVLADIRRWQEENPERTRETKRRSAAKVRRDKPEEYRKKAVASIQRQLQSLPFRLAFNLRARLRKAIKRGSKAGSAVRDLGCSIEELKTHLSGKWKDGMSWDNYGSGAGKWSIDHIIPLASFDLTNRQHVTFACNYLNLQPLWCVDNSSKGKKLDFQLG